jgi:hypothetical protein
VNRSVIAFGVAVCLGISTACRSSEPAPPASPGRDPIAAEEPPTTSTLAPSPKPTDEASPREVPILVPTSPRLSAECQMAAGLLDFPVPCPRQLPPTTSEVRCHVPADFAASTVTPKEGCAVGEGFILEPEGLHSPVFHLVIAAARSRSDDCTSRMPHRLVEVHGRRGILIDCSERAGLHSDHVLLRWREAGVVIVVSTHHHTEANRILVRRIAQLTRLVSG